MRSKTAIWFEAKIAYEKVMEDGMQKKVTELYVIDAISFAEAEHRIMEEMSAYISGEFSVKDIKIAPYSEIFFSDEELADRWYKAKLQFITIDEKGGAQRPSESLGGRPEKEKRSNVTYLVQACTLNGAVKNIDAVMGGTMINYVQANVGETKIVDVFEYKKDNGEG